jgi:prenyltransferase beta subunit
MNTADNDILKKVIDETATGKGNLRVHLVIPPTGDNPWRTQQDYIEDLREARERHEMFQKQHAILQEQHQVILKSSRLNKYAVIAAVLSSLAALWTAYYTTTKKDTVHTHKELQQPEQTQEPIKTKRTDDPKTTKQPLSR